MPSGMAPGRDSGGSEAEDAKGPHSAVAEAVLYAKHQMSIAQLENALAEQQRELHMLVAHHYETARQMLVARDQMAMACQIENQELRAQIGELRKQNSTPAKRQRDQALLSRQHMQSHKVLLKRDQEARKTEQENQQLRSTLAEMKSRPPRPRTAEDDVAMNFGSDDNSPVSRSQISGRIPDFSAQPSTVRPSTSHGKRSMETRDEATGVNLLMALKLPGQVYDEGNFFPKDETSDSEEPDLPPWDAELTKRPKRAVAVMDLRERMRQMFKTGQVKSTELYKEDGYCSRLASHQHFETVVYAFIVANVIWLGIDAVVNTQDLLVNAPAYVIAVENIFCVFFLSELSIRLGAYKSWIVAIRDPWIMIDSLLVLGMILETWIFFLILQFSDVDFSLVDQSSLRLLRVLRVSRVARIVRILRALPELLILVKALGVATRSVFFTFCLLMLTIYLFALACTTIGKDTPSGALYFSTLGQSMFTLFFHGLFGFDLPSIATNIFADNAVLAVVFCLYLVCAPLTMMNLLVAVLVEVVGVLASAEQEMVQNQYEWDQMMLCLSELSSDDTINIDQFKKILDKRDALMGMRALGIDVIAMLETPQLIFGEVTTLSFAEFSETILALRDTNTATVRDINTMTKRVIMEIQGTVGQLSKIKEKQSGSSKERATILKLSPKSNRQIGR